MFSALLGKPVRHSVSDSLFSSLAKRVSIPFYEHRKIEVEPGDLGAKIAEIVAEGCVGFNITMPYKYVVMQFLDELDESARLAGAVNCVKVEENGFLKGYNTDGIGAWKSISQFLRRPTHSDRALILGCGGAAFSIIAMMLRFRIPTTVLSRNPEEIERASNFFKNEDLLSFSLLNDENMLHRAIESDFLIQATPVGMWPDTDHSLIDASLWDRIMEKKVQRETYLFDVILNPRETKMMKEATRRGVKSASGLWMMIYQAIEAFRIWTGFDLENLPLENLYQELSH